MPRSATPAHAHDVEAPAQPIDHRDQRRHVGGVAGHISEHTGRPSPSIKTARIIFLAVAARAKIATSPTTTVRFAALGRHRPHDAAKHPLSNGIIAARRALRVEGRRIWFETSRKWRPLLALPIGHNTARFCIAWAT
jgi:hypothetical protein